MSARNLTAITDIHRSRGKSDGDTRGSDALTNHMLRYRLLPRCHVAFSDVLSLHCITS
jgi:hypothetical protein